MVRKLPIIREIFKGDAITNKRPFQGRLIIQETGEILIFADINGRVAQLVSNG